MYSKSGFTNSKPIVKMIIFPWLISVIIVSLIVCFCNFRDCCFLDLLVECPCVATGYQKLIDKSCWSSSMFMLVMTSLMQSLLQVFSPFDLFPQKKNTYKYTFGALTFNLSSLFFIEQEGVSGKPLNLYIVFRSLYRKDGNLLNLSFDSEYIPCSHIMVHLNDRKKRQVRHGTEQTYTSVFQLFVHLRVHHETLIQSQYHPT
jgi:hypothetical protein